MRLQLLERGHKVVAAARNPDKAEGLASLAVKYGDALAMVSLDVGDPASIKVRAFSMIPTLQSWSGIKTP